MSEVSLAILLRILASGVSITIDLYVLIESVVKDKLNLATSPHFS